MRSFLTMLGIVIGVASIIALITIVQGATGSITSQISALGADKLTIQAIGTPLKQGLNEKDLDKLSQVEYVSHVSPTISGNTSVIYNGQVKTAVSVQGKNQVYFQTGNDNMSAGRTINILDVENKNQVAVIGSDIATELFYGENPIGKEITVKGNTYTVIGLLKPTSGFSMGSTNKAILVPYTAAMTTLNIRNITSVEIFMSDSSKADIIISNIEGVLREAFNYRDNAFSIFNMQDMLDTMGNITGMMSLLLAGIASISLIVGGIGIMNMMLVSVTERTAEIGLRKALGAEPSSIQLQFLIESAFLSFVGGIIGIIVGLGIAIAASRLIGFDLSMALTTVVLAAGFSAAVGIIFGWMPARNASRLNPIDALRHI
jgi:putative ABC transport system permease protein